MWLTYRGHIILIILGILFPLTCAITYTMAVLLGHVTAYFPFISDTGTRPPESCVFGFLLGIYAVISARVIQLRYQQVLTHYCDSNRKSLLLTNKIALFIGWSSSLGVYVVATFQETNVLVVHQIGAFLAFLVGTIYMWLQTVISFKTSLLPGYSHGYTRLRLILSIINTIGIIVFSIFVIVSQPDKPADKLHWGVGSKGFTFHVIATFVEWIVAFIATAFFLTFAKEFHKFEIEEERVNFLESGSNFELNGKTTTNAEAGISNPTLNGISRY